MSALKSLKGATLGVFAGALVVALALITGAPSANAASTFSGGDNDFDTAGVMLPLDVYQFDETTDPADSIWDGSMYLHIYEDTSNPGNYLVSFTILNTSDPAPTGGDPATITEIYFENGTYDMDSILGGHQATIVSVESRSDVNMAGPGAVVPSNPPGWNAGDSLVGELGNWDGTYAGWEALGLTSGQQTAAGIQSGDALQIIYAVDESGLISTLAYLGFLDGDETLSSNLEEIQQALADAIGSDHTNNLNIAFFIRNCDGFESCKVVANPLPGTVWLLGSALLGLLGFGAKRRLKAA